MINENLVKGMDGWMGGRMIGETDKWIDGDTDGESGDGWKHG